MAAPAYATDLATIIIEMPNTTGWTLISSGGGGANSLTAPETDDFIQGANCISRNPWASAAIRGMVYNAATTIAAGDVVVVWIKSDATQALATVASGGIQALIGSGTGALNCYYVDGSDTAVKGGWIAYFIDPRTGSVTPSTTIGSPSGTTSYFGARWSVPVSGPSKGFPFKIDAIRRGRNIEITAGDSGTPATWAAAAVHADATAQRWGLLQVTDTGAKVAGRLYWGTSGTAVYSRDSNKTIVLAKTPFTVSDFTQIIVSNASTDIEWTGITISALDTANRGTFTVLNNAAFSYLAGAFEDINTTTDGGTNSVWDGTVWRRTNAVTAAGGSFLDCAIRLPTVATDAAGFIYNVATDPDGVIDGMTFTKGTNSHHAIEFGTSAPTTMTIRDCNFTGFSGTGTAATLNFLRTTGSTTVNLIGCTGTITAQVTGSHTVTLVTDPVTLSVHVQNINTGAAISGARVYVLAAATGPLPFEDTVTITRSGSTATVAHTSHGFDTNHWVKIEGADQEEYNGGKQITVTGVNSYTFAVSGTPTTPATGTILATAIIIFGTTNGSGDITDSRSYGSDQDFTGRVRYSSSPYYKSSPLSGTIDNAIGLPVTVSLIPDE